MRQILASFFCFGENLVKSNEVKTNLTKRSFIERKIRQFVTLQKPRAEDEEDHRGRGKPPMRPRQSRGWGPDVWGQS